MKQKFKPIPTFATEDAERDFWATADTSEYFDFSKAEPVSFPNLKLSTETISLRLPAPLLNRIKELANAQDVPYQSLMKIFLHDRVQLELKDAAPIYDAQSPVAKKSKKSVIKKK